MGKSNAGNSALTDAPELLSNLTAPGMLNPYSCLPCRGRKKKCDRISPCNNCRRLGVECHFVPRRPSSRQPASGRIQERLQHLETIIGRLQKHIDPINEQNVAIHNSKVPEPTPNDTDSALSFDPSIKGDAEIDELGTEFGRLALENGRSRYVTGNFWASLADEVEDLKSLLQERAEETEERSLHWGQPFGMHNHVNILGFTTALQNLIHLHPQAEQIPLYWNLFKENCDVLIKVLHVPTTETLILRATRQLDRIPRGFEALMMAVYFAVVVSLSPEECTHVLGGEKVELIWRFKLATENALARANLLETDEIVTIQAFAIFLTGLRIHSTVRAMSTLTALLVRLAQNAGIHRDGTHFGLSPFVIEMRRRLWWAICVLASRAAEDTGHNDMLPPGSVDTQLPLNVNDSDLFMKMKQLPQPMVGLTEMTFSVVRYESTKIFRHVQDMWTRSSSNPRDAGLSLDQTLEERMRTINDIQRRVHELYLRHLDLTDPLSWYTDTICRIVFTKMWLVTYHPYLRREDPNGVLRGVKDRLFIDSTTAIELWLRLNEEQSTHRWRWLCETYVQWYALAFLLSELCKRTYGDPVDRAWNAVDGALCLGVKIHSASCQGGVPRGQDSELGDPSCEPYKPLRKLLKRAREVRMGTLAGTRADGKSTEISKMPILDQFPASRPDCVSSLDMPNRAQDGLVFGIDPYMLDAPWPSENPILGNDLPPENQLLEQVELENWYLFNTCDSSM